ncbi:MAG TPA: hypothetical protein ENN41_02515 [Sediminispirochaeta sp.]|nr:hypothetical protein [Sediminispirochaeta sp.]
MKKSILILAIALMIALSGALYAEQSEYFVKTVPISKVYMHNLGYRIVYEKNDFDIGVLYIPNDWFDLSGQEEPKAELLMTREPEVPYFSVFWKNGEFSHIRLYLHKSLTHGSYGSLKNPESMNDQFDVETLALEF